LAEKTGRYFPTEPFAKHETMVWLMWQMGGFGPMLGQAHHFLKFAKEYVPYAKARFHTETKRLYGVLDGRLDGRDWMAAGETTIADFATYPWVMRHEFHQIDLDAYPNVARWAAALGTRPDVARGMAVPA
ncbi:MAG: glutathione binding-like protein, partial [Pseudomonadota bacterium]